MEVPVVLKDRVRPAVSVNPAMPVTAPVAGVAALLVALPATGTPGSTFTVIVTGVLRAPLLAVTVKVSVVPSVAAWRWVWVGV